MGVAPHNGLETLQENNLNLITRQGVCLVSIAIHWSLFAQDLSPWLIALIAFQGLIYAPLLHYVPCFQRNSLFNLQFDAALYGFCIGLWGFNPFLTSSYVASANIINMASGGIKLCLRGALLMLVFALIAGVLNQWQFRADLPLAGRIAASIGLVAFMSVLGVRMFSINTRLRQTRNDLHKQKEELLRLNTLALAVNSHLNVDIIMQTVMGTIEGLYPFEALYILSLDSDKRRLEISGIYGSSITEEEHQAFLKFQFDLDKDRDSIFVSGLVKQKVYYIPNITPSMVENGAKIDRNLFAVKPSVSLAYFPVYVEDQVIAGACFINYDKVFTLEKEDVQRIQQYLIQVGTAVRNAKLIQELEKAKVVAEIARNEAEVSEEAKGRFLANMSHEIRTPLTAIMGYSEALLDIDVNAEDKRKFIGHILRSGKHLLTMINDILDISKIEAQKIEIERIPCDLLEILCDIDSYLSIKTRAKKLTFKIDIDYPIPQQIHSDPTRLKQILLNLSNNAVKFTEHGGISIKVKLASDGVVAIDVIDSGIGINKDDQNKIFSAFDQADTSTTRLYGGTGLGLYISKNLAILLGGDITVKSNPGGGSTFTLTTPIVDRTPEFLRTPEQFAAAMDRVRESKTYSGTPSLQGCVLIVEDNKENQNLIDRLVKQSGMTTEIANNGEEAIRAAQNNTYAAILMDMQMPIMGGREATVEMIKSGITTPIIAFTANVMKHHLDDYRTLGFYDVLEKPIIREHLFATLKRAVLHQKIRPARVLIAEDNEVNQMVLFRYITKVNEKAVITLAQNGLEAVDKIAKEHFDLIFMDMQMPVMGGIEATQKIRSMGYNTPLYMVTGNVAKHDIEICLQAGATGHLAKPIDRDRITEIIQRHLIFTDSDAIPPKDKINNGD